MIQAKTDDGPNTEVEPGGRRDPGETAKQDGEIDFAPERGAASMTGDEVDDDGGDGAEGEGPDEGAVEGSGAEEMGGADDTPEDGAVEVDARDGAVEAVDGGGGAEAGDVGEHPVEDSDLRQARDEGGEHLHGEEEAGRDLHVVS